MNVQPSTPWNTIDTNDTQISLSPAETESGALLVRDFGVFLSLSGDAGVAHQPRGDFDRLRRPGVYRIRQFFFCHGGWKHEDVARARNGKCRPTFVHVLTFRLKVLGEGMTEDGRGIPNTYRPSRIVNRISTRRSRIVIAH